MTRRKVIFYNDLDGSYIVSEEYNGDKTEMEQFRCGTCDYDWSEFMAAMNDVTNLADFLKVLSWMTASYHATMNGSPLPYQTENILGTRLEIAHSNKELYDLTRMMDEIWEIKRGIPGARLLDASSYAPKTYNGKEVLDESDFHYNTAKPGDYVTQELVDDAMDCLPPVSMSTRCSQMGEPYNTKLDEKTGKWRNTYATFRKVAGEWPDGIWEYCGHCFCGETEERGQNIPIMANGKEDNNGQI